MRNGQRQLNRRQFIAMGSAGMSLFLARCGVTFSPPPPVTLFGTVSQLGALQPADENGVMLPAGFRSRIVARSGEIPVAGSGYRWHGAPDGGACFPAPDGGWVYVSNSELSDGSGGVGALRFNTLGEVIDAYPILVNTSRNCAGGATPWGTWLSCEEHDEGQVYECDPFGERAPQVRPMLGTFQHEAVVVDSPRNCMYLTEDKPDGAFYRFIGQSRFPDLSRSILQVAQLREQATGFRVVWHTITDPSASQIPTRQQSPYTTAFNGGEGLAMLGNKAYFTTKGDNRVWCYDAGAETMEIVYDAALHPNPILTGVDNVVITPRGEVIVAEDGGNMQVIALMPDGSLMPLVQIIGHDASEICGPAFDPGYSRFYFSSQRGASGRNEDGVIFEISAVL